MSFILRADSTVIVSEFRPTNTLRLRYVANKIVSYRETGNKQLSRECRLILCLQWTF